MDVVCKTNKITKNAQCGHVKQLSYKFCLSRNPIAAYPLAADLVRETCALKQRYITSLLQSMFSINV